MRLQKANNERSLRPFSPHADGNSPPAVRGPRGGTPSRDLARLAGLSPAAAQKELAALASKELVIARPDGNRVYYRANPSRPLYPELHRIVLKTAGIAAELLPSSRMRIPRMQGRPPHGFGLVVMRFTTCNYPTTRCAFIDVLAKMGVAVIDYPQEELATDVEW